MKIPVTRSLLAACILFLSAPCFSQIKPLQVSDSMPSVLVELIQNDPPDSSAENRQMGSLADQQIIVLDFWATWCGSCLKKMPLLDSLQQEYSAQLKIVLVNSRNTADDEEKIKEFFTKRKRPDGEPFQFKSLTADTILHKYFPHTALPHYIWIKDNRVVAITGTAEVTRKNITDIINGKLVSLPVKNDEEKRRQIKSKQTLPKEN